MITAITLENFKGIRDKVRIELKPITMLFGANSAGKSTIIQAIHYAREILERQNLDPGKTLYGGDAIDLGGFKNLVYNRDLTKQIVMRFDLDLSNIDLPEYDDSLFYISQSGEVKSAWVEYTIKWDRFKNEPLLASYEVGINGIKVAGINSTGGAYHIVEYNWEQPLLSGGYDGPATPEFSTRNLFTTLSEWGKRLKIEIDPDVASSGFGGSWMEAKVCELLIGPSDILRDLLRRFRYIGPLRQIPPRNYQSALTRSELHWSNGLAAWDSLYKNSDLFINEVSDWLSSEGKLNTGYSLLMRRYKEIDLASPLMVALNRGTIYEDYEDIPTELEKMPTRKRLVLIDESKKLEVLPQDVGVGISQILPVIVAAVDNIGADIIAIEQPELHIHPALQARLGDLFIQQIKKRDVLFLLETHSEHLILRLLRRIRETNDNELPDESVKLLPEQVSVIYVEQTVDGVKLSQLRIDQTGEFIDRWPNGFFDERAEELF